MWIVSGVYGGGSKTWPFNGFTLDLNYYFQCFPGRSPSKISLNMYLPLKKTVATFPEIHPLYTRLQ